MADNYELEEVETTREVYDIPTLSCPNCGFFCTHHEETIVHGHESWWEKDGEVVEVEDWEEAKESDEYEHKTKGVGISVEPNGLEVEEIETENPSSRRDAVSVIFSCEGCSVISSLQIVQHKGNTFIGTKKVGEQKPDVPNSTPNKKREEHYENEYSE